MCFDLLFKNPMKIYSNTSTHFFLVLQCEKKKFDSKRKILDIYKQFCERCVKYTILTNQYQTSTTTSFFFLLYFFTLKLLFFFFNFWLLFLKVGREGRHSYKKKDELKCHNFIFI